MHNQANTKALLCLTIELRPYWKYIVGNKTHSKETGEFHKHFALSTICTRYTATAFIAMGPREQFGLSTMDTWHTTTTKEIENKTNKEIGEIYNQFALSTMSTWYTTRAFTAMGPLRRLCKDCVGTWLIRRDWL